ncbi:MAG: hypothetical protein IKU79_09180 [Bacteroidaceae bacterium]|nr:hypothetical protein [Bacteroidaceae bacterium]
MKFDFLYHTYTLTITVFAAVFGMAYPLILQAIERIDQKYTSSVLSTDLRKRWQFKAFNVLIIVCIACVGILAYVLECVDNEWWKYGVVSAAVFLILLLMIDVVLLVQQIIDYYSPKDLLRMLKKNAKKRDADALLDLAKFAAKTDDFMLHVNSLSEIASLFYEEQQKAPKDKPVEYSPELYDILSKVAKRVGDPTLFDDRYNYIGILATVYNHSSEGGLSQDTLLRIWEMVNRVAKAGNTGWFRDYWTYADQYYRFYKLNGRTPLSDNNLKEFYRYHVMIGGLLIYFKRYDWLTHIMRFSQSQPGKFELIPGTLGRIFDMVWLVDELNEKPFGLYKKYQYLGLEEGAKIDDAIAGYTYQYLALLIIRLWTYNDYNINYADPFILPAADEEFVENNERMINRVEWMKKNVERWYNNGLVTEFGLSNVPDVNVVKSKLDEYIGVLKQKIIEIDEHDEVDEHKAKVIRDEMIVHNANRYCPIPMKVDDEVLDETQFNTTSTPIRVTNRIEKPFITKGSKKELGNFGGSLVHELNFRMLNEYLRADFSMMPYSISYSINQKDLLEAIDKLELPEDYVIVEIGNALELYEFRDKITVDGDNRMYNGHKILSLGMAGFTNSIWILRGSEVPFIEIVETAFTGGSYTEIDANNHLYSNIGNIKPPYDVQLVQTIKVYAPKDYGNTCLLKVMCDYSGNKYELDKVTNIIEEEDVAK